MDVGAPPSGRVRDTQGAGRVTLEDVTAEEERFGVNAWRVVPTDQATEEVLLEVRRRLLEETAEALLVGNAAEAYVWTASGFGPLRWDDKSHLAAGVLSRSAQEVCLDALDRLDLAWVARYPRHFKIAWGLLAELASREPFDTIGTIALEVGADLANPFHYIATCKLVDSLALRVWPLDPSYARASGMINAWGKALGDAESVAKDGRPFDVNREVARLRAQPLAEVGADVWRAAAARWWRRAGWTPSTLSLDEFIGMPLFYNTGGSAGGLRAVRVDGKRVRITKGGILLDPGALRELGAAIAVKAVRKVDTANPRVIYAVGWQDAILGMYVAQASGFVAPPAVPYGDSALTVAADVVRMLSQQRFSGLDAVGKSDDKRNFDGQVSHATVVEVVKAFCRHAEGVSPQVADAARAWISALEGATLIGHPSGEYKLFSGLFMTSQVGSLASAVFEEAACAAATGSVGARSLLFGSPAVLGDDLVNTAAGYPTLVAWAGAAQKLKIEFSWNKSVFGGLSFLKVNALRVDGADRLLRVGVGTLLRSVERDTTQRGAYGYSLLRALSSTWLEGVSRLEGTAKADPGPLLRAMCRDWGLPVRLANVPLVCGGLAWAAAQPYYLLAPPTPDLAEANPAIIVPDGVSARIASSFIALGADESWRAPLEMWAAKWITLTAIDPDYEAELRAAYKRVERAHRWPRLSPNSGWARAAARRAELTVEQVAAGRSPLDTLVAIHELRTPTDRSFGSWQGSAFAAVRREIGDRAAFIALAPASAAKYERYLRLMGWRAFYAWWAGSSPTTVAAFGLGQAGREAAAKCADLATDHTLFDSSSNMLREIGEADIIVARALAASAAQLVLARVLQGVVTC
jgi:hypothetical protein